MIQQVAKIRIHLVDPVNNSSNECEMLSLIWNDWDIFEMIINRNLRGMNKLACYSLTQYFEKVKFPLILCEVPFYSWDRIWSIYI